MKKPTQDKSSYKLTDDHFEKCVNIAVGYLKTNPSIRNRDIRRVAGISYDQAIYFFNRSIFENRLTRLGTGVSTCYILPQVDNKTH